MVAPSRHPASTAPCGCGRFEHAGSLSEALRGHSEAVIGVAYASDGTLASASYDGTVRLWQAGRRTLGEPLGRHEDRVTAISISPDGTTLASGGFDRTVRLWDMVTRRPTRELGDDRLDSVESIAFSPDGRTLAAADVEGSIWLWEMPGGTLAARLEGHDGAVHGIAFAGDGRTLASAGFDGTVRLWSVAEQEQIGDPLTGHRDPVLSVAFSADGRTLASGGSDGTLRLWDVAEHGAARATRARRGRGGLDRRVRPGRAHARLGGRRRPSPVVGRVAPASRSASRSAIRAPRRREPRVQPRQPHARLGGSPTAPCGSGKSPGADS